MIDDRPLAIFDGPERPTLRPHDQRVSHALGIEMSGRHTGEVEVTAGKVGSLARKLECRWQTKRPRQVIVASKNTGFFFFFFFFFFSGIIVTIRARTSSRYSGDWRLFVKPNAKRTKKERCVIGVEPRGPY